MTSYESDWQKLNIDDGSEVLVWFWSLHLSAACHPETTRVVTPGLVPEQVQSEGELPVRLPEHLNDLVVRPVRWWIIHFVGQQTGNVLMRRNTPECFNRGPWQNQVFGPRPQDVYSVWGTGHTEPEPEVLCAEDWKKKTTLTVSRCDRWSHVSVQTGWTKLRLQHCVQVHCDVFVSACVGSDWTAPVHHSDTHRCVKTFRTFISNYININQSH